MKGNKQKKKILNKKNRSEIFIKNCKHDVLWMAFCISKIRSVMFHPVRGDFHVVLHICLMYIIIPFLCDTLYLTQYAKVYSLKRCNQCYTGTDNTRGQRGISTEYYIKSKVYVSSACFVLHYGLVSFDYIS